MVSAGCVLQVKQEQDISCFYKYTRDLWSQDSCGDKQAANYTTTDSSMRSFMFSLQRMVSMIKLRLNPGENPHKEDTSIQIPLTLICSCICASCCLDSCSCCLWNSAMSSCLWSCCLCLRATSSCCRCCSWWPVGGRWGGGV